MPLPLVYYRGDISNNKDDGGFPTWVIHLPFTLFAVAGSCHEVSSSPSFSNIASTAAFLSQTRRTDHMRRYCPAHVIAHYVTCVARQ